MIFATAIFVTGLALLSVAGLSAPTIAATGVDESPSLGKQEVPSEALNNPLHQTLPSDSDVDLASADAFVTSAGSPGSNLFWWGQELAITASDRANTELQLRIETNEIEDTTRVAGTISLDSDGEALIRTDLVAENTIPGDFVVAVDSSTFLVIDSGQVVGVTSNVDRAEFELAEQRLGIGFEPNNPRAGNNVTFTSISNRGQFFAVVMAESTSDRELLNFFSTADRFEATEVDVDGDGDADDNDGIRITIISSHLRQELSTEALPRGVNDTISLEVTDTGTTTAEARLHLGGDDADTTDVDPRSVDARISSRGSAGSNLAWYGQVLAISHPNLANVDLQLRVEMDEENGVLRPVGEISLDANGEGRLRTEILPDEYRSGDFIVAQDSRTFYIIEDGQVVATTADPDEAEFELADQSLQVEFTPNNPAPNGTTTISIQSNRGRYRAWVTAESASDEELIDFFGQNGQFNPIDVDVNDDGDINGDGIRISVNSTTVERPLSVAPLTAGQSDTISLRVTDTVATNASAELSVEESLSPRGPDVTGDGNPATDPDRDGLYEDVNGDGATTPGDATVLFDAAFENNPAVMDNVVLFDFNDDGSVTPGDATVLFNEIFG